MSALQDADVFCDEAFAQVIARSEQEHEDAALARHLAVASSGVDRDLNRGLDGTQAANSDVQQLEALYVSCEIGANDVQMLVDTGAQTSIISQPLAEQLDLLSRLDRTMRGVASGVGQADIVGRLWGITVKLGHVEFQLDFSVLSMPRPIIILGLDLMRRFRCLVDLDKGCLVFGGHGGVQVPFVASADGHHTTSIVPHILAQGRSATALLRARDAASADIVFATVRRLLENISRHPREEKYRCLSGSSARLQREVFAHPEAVELLCSAGFEAVGPDLILPKSASLDRLHTLCTPGAFG
eukprot:TRINITY_DN58444_c0_g1_i1.p1 TRINITY_DN58444_c0_g1~~TRINITY_DN58444_c0_g1_i1.p1  ORF type:complete len:299 (+),score=38.35 TRINITY_DN58444_c0_g1_i1:90-986(+)